MRRAVLCVALAGCNRIFGLTDPVGLVDAPPPIVLPDAPPPPMFGECIVEPFDTLDPAIWTRLNPNMPLQVEFSGELVIDGSSPTEVDDGIVTTSAYDFTGGSVQVQITDSITQSGRGLVFELQMFDGSSLRIERTQGVLSYQTQINGFSVSGSGLAPEDDAPFWRIRHDEASGKLVIETSPDGVTWTVQVSDDDTISIIESKIQLSGSADTGAVDRTAFDNFKLAALCPP